MRIVPDEMRTTSFNSKPISEIPFLNAGRGQGSFYVDRLPVHVARLTCDPRVLTREGLFNRKRESSDANSLTPVAKRGIWSWGRAIARRIVS